MGAFVRNKQIKHNDQQMVSHSLPKKVNFNKARCRRVQFVESETRHQTRDGGGKKFHPAFSSQERATMWWSKEELKFMKRRDHIFFAYLKNGRDRKMRGLKFKLDKIGHCSRGLELYIDQTRWTNRREHLEEVMYLQGARSRLNESRIEQICRIISKRSAMSIKQATEIAQSDARESFDTFFNDEELRKLLQRCISINPCLCP